MTERIRLIEGDCIDVMGALPDESVHAIITDPPYGLEFMGAEWDRFRLDDPGTNRHRGDHAGAHDGNMRESGSIGLRGGPGGGTRPKTSRCTGCGRRDQFRKDHECEDYARWVNVLLDPYAAPPTSLAFSEWVRQWAHEAHRILTPGGHLLAFGSARTYHRLAAGIEDAGFDIRDQLQWLYVEGMPKGLNVSKAIDAAAGAERPIVGTGNGKRSPNRILGDMPPTEFDLTEPATPEAVEWDGWNTSLKPAHEPVVFARKPFAGTTIEAVLEHGTGAINVRATRLEAPTSSDGSGRWPANVIADDPTATDLARQGIARGYFYCPKPSTAERTRGLEALAANPHPTVKPIDLIRWLIRLVTPPGGVVLDPFLGSGTTAIAAHLENRPVIGIELDPTFLDVARHRVDAWTRQGVLDL